MMLSAFPGDDWYSRSEPFVSTFRDMENEIAELRTMTKVTRLRQQIECRHEGEWFVVRDVPDEKSKGGTRKVTAYGRASRSVTRSVSRKVDLNSELFNGGLANSTNLCEERSELPGSVLVEFPDEPSKVTSPKSEVEIVEIPSEPVKPPTLFQEKVPENSSSPAKKTSVVTLGKGNLVFIDSEDSDSHFHVTGISKGKVADVVSTLERVYAAEDKHFPKKNKKVGFSKTEVHFAPDSGRVNIVETDEKPPPTQLLRKKRRPKSFPDRTHKANFPKLYFGDEEKQQFASDSDIKAAKEHVFPVLREPSPLLSTRDILKPLKSSISTAASPIPEPWTKKNSFPKRSSPEPEVSRLKHFPNNENKSRVSESTDSKLSPNVYLGKVSPKLSKLLQNSMDHEFQLKHFQIVGKNLDDQSSPKQTVVNIRLQRDIHLARPLESTDASIDERDNKSEPLYINREVIVPENVRPMAVVGVKDKTPKPKPRTSITKITDNSSLKASSTSVLDDSKKVKTVSKSPAQDTKRSITPSSRISAHVRKELTDVKPLKFQPRNNAVSRPSEVSRRSCKSRTETQSRIHKSSTGRMSGESTASSRTSNKKNREPLRSFEKVSNGWVGHCIVPINSTNAATTGAKPSMTANEYATPSASAKLSGFRRVGQERTTTAESKSGQRGTKEDKQLLSSSFPANRQFSLSKEHLRSAKLVKELVTNDPTKMVKNETTAQVMGSKPKVVNVVRPRVIDSTRRLSGAITGSTKERSTPTPRTTPTNKSSATNRRRFHLEDSYGRLRRDSERSDDSVVRADEEVRAYMLNTRHKMKNEDLLDEMSASYSEISDVPHDCSEPEGASDSPLPRPKALPLSDRLSRHGTVTRQGDLITFVADDIQTKIKLSSPNSWAEPACGSPSCVEATALLECLEVEASALAASVDSLTEALSETLHGISALTVDCLEAYRDVVCKTCDSVDANIKAMYQLMAKCEEISKSMAPIYKLSAHVKQIKHVLDLLEASPG